MNEKKTDMAYWGAFSAQDVHAHRLDLRPDVIPMSRGEMHLHACSAILRHGHGFVEACDSGDPKDGDGNWMPLFTYPCVEYLRQFDLRDKRVFEWGSGASTLYWMDRARSVVSIENNPEWFGIVSRRKNERVRLVLDESRRFPLRIRDESEPFDLIVIDSRGYRYDCAVEATKKLASGGMIILDNADWHPRSAGVLRDAGLIQVDFSGFKVTESHTSTTSVFLHRAFAFPTLQPLQPTWCVGAKRILSDWDQPQVSEPSASG